MTFNFNFVPSDEIARIRAKLTHPIVDADGHQNELVPLVADFARDIAGADVAKRLAGYKGAGKSRPTASGEIGRCGASPLDRLTTSLPALLYQRLDEIGIDFSITYPSWGTRVMDCPEDEIRQVGCRALNNYYAQVYEGFRDRIEPVAVIPIYTPDEACAELRHAIGELGLKSVVMSGRVIRRPRPDEPDRPWVDTMGHESLYNYDPVWQTCRELGVVPAFHGSGADRDTRTSRTNLVYNHLGHFASNQESVCRSLIMGGATRRFPDLQFLFLEGGVSWGCQLFADLLGHFDKLNRDAVHRMVGRYREFQDADEIISQFATELMALYHDDLAQKVGESRLASTTTAVRYVENEISDEFEEAQITSPEDIVRIFIKQLSFGCEADDPFVGLAFDQTTLPHGARLNPVLGSDIGHWDVPDIRHVLVEAWELVEHHHLTAAQFQLFACDNVARMVTAMNPHYFVDTAVEGSLALDGTTKS